MFTKLRIKNFKAWGDQLWKDGVELAPLTLVLGVNSAGKSSLFQPLRVLLRTVTAPDPRAVLRLAGGADGLLNLGSYAEVVHQGERSASIGIGFELALERRYGGARVDLEYGLDGTRVRTLRSETSVAGNSWSLRHLQNGRYELREHKPGRANRENFLERVPHEFEPVRGVSLPGAARERLSDDGKLYTEVDRRILAHLADLEYLGPLRAPPSRYAHWAQEPPGTLGADGHLATLALVANLVDNREHPALLRAVAESMRKLGLADDFQVRQVGDSPMFEVMVTIGGRTTNLLDVGFGVAQALPVVTLAHFAKSGSTVLLEEPEIHLHPLAQSQLGSLLVESALQRRLQLLVETHSEHVFRRIQLHVARGDIGVEQVRMYFVDRTAQGAPELRQLELDELGRVRNWPANFFGDAVGETERQMRAAFLRLRPPAPPNRGGV